MSIEAGALWLLGSVIAPDAWTRTLNAIRGSRGEYRRLTKAVQEESGLVAGRPYKRWFGRDDVWQALVSAAESEIPMLVESLEIEIRKSNRWPRRKLEPGVVRRNAEILVGATFQTLLQSLDPSRAIAITGDRLRREISGVRKILEVKENIEISLRKVPPPARGPLRMLCNRDPALAEQILGLHDAPAHPLVTFRSLVEDPPGWLATASPQVWLIFADILRSHGDVETSAQVYEKIADLGWERDRSFALAAYFRAKSASDPISIALLEKARAVGGDSGKLIDLVDALVKGPTSKVVEMVPDILNIDVELAGSVLTAIFESKGASDALNSCKSLVVKYPDYSVFRIMQIRFTMANAQRQAIALSAKLRNEMLNLAVEARDLRREWRGPSGEASMVACEIALSQMEIQSVLTIGLVPPDGEALEAEITTPGLRRLVAEAAMVGGFDDIAKKMIREIEEPFEVKFLKAEMIMREAGNRNEAVTLYSEAWELCRDDSDKLAVWHSLASIGADLPDREALEAIDEIQSTLVIAQHEAATGRIDDAIVRLRAKRNRSPHIVELLVHLYLRDGDIDSVVEILTAAATHFDHPRFLADAAAMLSSRGRVGDAEPIAVRALVGLPCDTHMRVVMHEVLVEAAQERLSWREMESRVRALIDEVGEEPKYRWLLVGAFFNQRENQKAWHALSSAPPLIPSTYMQARVWIDLNCSFREDPALAEEIFGLLDRFSEFDQLVGSGLGAYMMWAPGKVLSAPVVDEGKRRIEDFVRLNPDHPTLRALTIPENATSEQLIALLRPMLEPGSRELLRMIQQVAEVKLPYGFLSAYVGKAYALVYVLRAAGCIPIHILDAEIFEEECSIARRALGGNVSIETSVLATFFHIRSLWPHVVRRFRQINLPLPAKSDIAQAIRSTDIPSSGSMGWDPVNDRFTISDTNSSTSEKVREHLQWMLDSSVDFNIPDWPSIRNLGSVFEDRDNDRFLSFVASLDYALEHQIPFFADDSALRSLARGLGLESFGTTALLQVLLESSDISQAEYSDALDELRYGRHVDLPLDALSISRIAERDNWMAGAAAFCFSRQFAWADSRAYKMWNVMARKAYEVDKDNLPGWLYMSIYGAVTGRQIGQAEIIASSLLMNATSICSGDPESIPSLLSCARDALKDQEFGDVLPSYVNAVRALFEPSHGPNVAARAILHMTSQLSEADRSTVRELIFSSDL